MQCCCYFYTCALISHIRKVFTNWQSTWWQQTHCTLPLPGAHIVSQTHTLSSQRGVVHPVCITQPKYMEAEKGHHSLQTLGSWVEERESTHESNRGTFSFLLVNRCRYGEGRQWRSSIRVACLDLQKQFCAFLSRIGSSFFTGLSYDSLVYDCLVLS